MTPEHIQQKIEQGMPGAKVAVSGAEGKFTAEVISDDFEVDIPSTTDWE